MGKMLAIIEHVSEPGNNGFSSPHLKIGLCRKSTDFLT